MTVVVRHNDGILDDMDGQWMKFCGLILSKMGLTELKITVEDVQKFGASFGGEMPYIVVDGRGGKDITLRVMSQSDGEKFVRESKSD